MEEIKKVGKAYRILIDSASDLWHRISFWTNASDVEFEDGKSAQEKIGDFSISKMSKKSFDELSEKDSNTIYLVSDKIPIIVEDTEITG